MNRRWLFGLAAAALLAGGRAHAGPLIYAMANGGNSPGRLYSIDVGANSTTLIGDFNSDGWSTVGQTPDGTLFFTQRFQSDIHVYSLNPNNIVVSNGHITNLQDRGSTALSGNIDGLTNGPDGNLYLTAYDNGNSLAGPRNGLYRFNPNNGLTEFVGTFANDAGPGGPNSFYTDLAFDPLTNALIGTGYNSQGQFTPYRIAAAQVLTGTNHVFQYVDAYASWNGLADGLAFDPTTGDLYASSDAGGVWHIDRTTGAILNNVGNNAGSEVGTDLAMQTSRNIGVPEPASVLLLATGAFGVMGYARRRRQPAA